MAMQDSVIPLLTEHRQRRYNVITTSFWRSYVQMMSFWLNNDVIIM